MAPSAPLPSSNASTNIPTAQDVTTSGGVWAPTSAKRDKLGELRTALAEIKDKGPFAPTLSDLATPVEQLDLWLVDGLQAIAQAADDTIVEDDDSAVWKQVQQWMTDIRKEKDDRMTKFQFEDYLRRFNREMERHLAYQMAQHPTLLQSVRDYVDIDAQIEQLESPPPQTLLEQKPNHLVVAMERYRLLLAQAASQVMLDAWKTLTTISDNDIDRAAVDGVTLDTDTASARLPLAKVEAVLESCLRGNSSTRVDAFWSLMDNDDDGLLQEVEMNSTCELAVTPVGKALDALLKEALEAQPVRTPPAADDSLPTKPLGWRQRRRETRHKRLLQKMFAQTIKKHFLDEVEMPHRLRCIYAWANKSHQDNAIKSVMVDEIAWTGRKRYVELPPKISLPEFREVQQEHFTHLDRVATEYLKSFREDLWIMQGNRRQRSELIRDSALFMGVVCAIDYAIIVL